MVVSYFAYLGIENERWSAHKKRKVPSNSDEWTHKYRYKQVSRDGPLGHARCTSWQQVPSSFWFSWAWQLRNSQHQCLSPAHTSPYSLAKLRNPNSKHTKQNDNHRKKINRKNLQILVKIQLQFKSYELKTTIIFTWNPYQYKNTEISIPELRMRFRISRIAKMVKRERNNDTMEGDWDLDWRDLKAKQRMDFFCFEVKLIFSRNNNDDDEKSRMKNLALMMLFSFIKFKYDFHF